VQLLGSYFSERKLLSIANRIQRITDWHLDRPNLD
jgi:Asp-tRNA(Asn)/Glu-tRNA(Gln) amidotransferase A subunit family amidase